MTVDLSSNARKLIAESPSGLELADFATWLETQHYTPFVIEQHLRRLAFVVQRLPGGGSGRTRSADQLDAAFGQGGGCSCPVLPWRDPSSHYRVVRNRRVRRDPIAKS